MGSGRNGETPGRIGAGWWLALFLLLGAALPVFCEDGGIDAPGLDVDGLPVGWYAVIDTSLGRILARLLPEQAPQAVAHFAALAEGRLEWNDPFTGKPRRDPYYDGVVIHRVAAGQRFEAGDPTGTSRGGAPFYLPPEGFGPVDFTFGGRLGMTRASLGRISGAVFFVSESGMPWLNGRHPCFGIVVDGKEVIRSISGVKADSAGKPLEEIRIDSVRVLPVGEPEPLPEPERFVPKRLDYRVRDDLENQ